MEFHDRRNESGRLNASHASATRGRTERPWRYQNCASRLSYGDIDEIIRLAGVVGWCRCGWWNAGVGFGRPPCSLVRLSCAWLLPPRRLFRRLARPLSGAQLDARSTWASFRPQELHR